MRRALAVLALVAACGPPSRAHDIPNARVDRSIQVTVRPGVLSVAYEVSLSELALTQDLRALIGTLPGADRRDWFAEYGRVSGPLNAKGLLVTVDGRPVELRALGFDLAVEDHPRFTFQFEAPIPGHGRLAIRDENYGGGEGTSRLALRGAGGVAVRGDDLPGDVALIPIRPVWELTDAEERRTQQVEADYAPGGGDVGAPSRSAVGPNSSARAGVGPSSDRLSRLLDRSTLSLPGLWLIALSLGAAHAVQPGHGKSLVAAATVGGRGGWRSGVALALVITAAHVSGVLAVAAALLVTRSSRYPEIHLGLARIAGFVIAAIGAWRLGRHLGGYGEHDGDADAGQVEIGGRSLVGLGLAGGLVPCWDAVLLVVMAEAVGRLALGVALLSAFSLGMAGVLVAVGVTGARLRSAIGGRDPEGVWARRLGLTSATALTAIGLWLLLA